MSLTVLTSPLLLPRSTTLPSVLCSAQPTTSKTLESGLALHALNAKQCEHHEPYEHSFSNSVAVWNETSPFCCLLPVGSAQTCHVLILIPFAMGGAVSSPFSTLEQQSKTSQGLPSHSAQHAALLSLWQANSPFQALFTTLQSPILTEVNNRKPPRALSARDEKLGQVAKSGFGQECLCWPGRFLSVTLDQAFLSCIEGPNFKAF